MDKIMTVESLEKKRKKFIKSVNRVDEIAHDILIQMYKEAKPSGDFDFLLKTYDSKITPNWNKQYFLRVSRQLGIMDSYFRENRVTYNEKIAILQLLSEFIPRHKEIEEIGNDKGKEETVVSRDKKVKKGQKRKTKRKQAKKTGN